MFRKALEQNVLRLKPEIAVRAWQCRSSSVAIPWKTKAAGGVAEILGPALRLELSRESLLLALGGGSGIIGRLKGT